ncbi:hypothetical protein FGIG_03475 [Fasciola gigantica]|uniref:Uncharacterized protein n=1 Tax=Fasciola gigantica TaxID=46835 RepID=A0A504YMC3_FASGI|nr:hypothetical protein FGIG_03475 [Fasciola gigantica]
MLSNKLSACSQQPTVHKHLHTSPSSSKQDLEEQNVCITPKVSQTECAVVRPSPAQSDFTPIGKYTRMRVATNYRLCESIEAIKDHIQWHFAENFSQNDMDEFWARHVYCTYMDKSGNKLSFFCFVFSGNAQLAND